MVADSEKIQWNLLSRFYQLIYYKSYIKYHFSHLIYDKGKTTIWRFGMALNIKDIEGMEEKPNVVFLTIYYVYFGLYTIVLHF